MKSIIIALLFGTSMAYANPVIQGQEQGQEENEKEHEEEQQEQSEEEQVEQTPEQEQSEEEQVEQTPEQEQSEEEQVEQTPEQEQSEEEQVEQTPDQEQSEEEQVEQTPDQEQSEEEQVEQTPEQEQSEEEQVEQTPEQEQGEEEQVEQTPEQEEEQDQEQSKDVEQENKDSFGLEGVWSHVSSMCSDGSPLAQDFGDSMIALQENKMVLAFNIAPSCSMHIDGIYRALPPFIYSTALETEYLGEGCDAVEKGAESSDETVMVYSFDGPNTLMTTTYINETDSNTCPAGTYRADILHRQ